MNHEETDKQVKLRTPCRITGLELKKRQIPQGRHPYALAPVQNKNRTTTLI